MISSKPKRFLFDNGLDFITLSLGLFLLFCFFFDQKVSKLEWSVLSVFFILRILILYWRKIYYSNKENKFIRVLLKHGKMYFVIVLLAITSYLLLPVGNPGIAEMLVFITAFPVIGLTLNFFFDASRRWAIKARKNIKYTLVAGTGNMAKVVERQLHSQRVPGYRIRGFIHCLNNEECLVSKDKVVGNLESIRQYLNENPVDEIVIALPGKPRKKIQNIIETADYFGIRVKYIPDYQELFGSNYKVTRFGEIEALNIRQLALDNTFQSFLKRSFDLIFSTVTLILLFPLFVLIALIIKLESPGPVFYCPLRVGKAGRPLKVLKFRSMRVNDRAAGGTLSTQKDDPRITRFGKFMRKYSLDELPQFINVLLGEMSVVGPRPHRQFLDKQLQERVYKYMVRHYVKPGITGWAQVNGWRGPTDTEEQRRQRTLHDLWYLENWSMWLDFKIVFMTIFSRKVHMNAF